MTCAPHKLTACLLCSGCKDHNVQACMICMLDDFYRSSEAALFVESPSGEYVLCDLCGQHVLRMDSHAALCDLPCAGGKLGLDVEVMHDQDCPRCV